MYPNLQHKIDINDLVYASERLPKNARILASAPVGWAKGEPHFNATCFLLSNGQMISIFHVKPIYYERQDGAIRPMGEIMFHHGNRRMRLREGYEKLVNWEYLVWLIKRCQLIGGGITMPVVNLPLLVNTVTTVYPDPNPETTTVDGNLPSSILGTWAAARDEATSPGPDDTSANSVYGQARNNFSITRGVFLFDTSSIPDGDTKNSAIFSLAADGFGPNNADTTSFRIITSSPASNTALIGADYATANFGTTSFGSMALSSWVNTADTYNDVTVNADGLTNISLTGVTKWATRIALDIDNTEPTGNNNFEGRMADTAGTTSDPKLAVTHTAAAAKAKGVLTLLRIG